MSEWTLDGAKMRDALIERLPAVWTDAETHACEDRRQLIKLAERLAAAVRPLAKIPLEEFNPRRLDQPLMGWNDHTLYVRDVHAARAALASTPLSTPEPK